MTTANGWSDNPVISGNGGVVTFTSAATNQVAGQIDANERYDMFLYDRATGAVSLMTHTPGSATTTANGPSGGAAWLSADGAWATFNSEATDQVAGQVDTGPFTSDVFLYERSIGTVRLVSHVPGSATNHRLRVQRRVLGARHQRRRVSGRVHIDSQQPGSGNEQRQRHRRRRVPLRPVDGDRDDGLPRAGQRGGDRQQQQ